MNTTHDTAGPDLENRLRAEFADRAANASGADTILTALAAQPIRTRRRAPSFGRWAAVAAAVAVVAAGIPIGLHLAEDDAPPSITTTDPQRDIVYHLTYAPGWLPPNFTTEARQGTADGAEQSWTWSAPGTSTTLPPTIQLNLWSTATPLGQGQVDQIRSAKDPITINGHQAWLADHDEFAAVSWQPSTDTVALVTVSGLLDVETTAERFAGSVRQADPANPITVTAGLTFGALPAGYQPFSQGAGGTQARPTRTIEAGEGPPSAAIEDLTAQLNPPDSQLPLPAGPRTPITARGRTGSYIDGDGETAVAVRLADGSWLTVVSSPHGYQNRPATVLTREQLVAVADDITVDPGPDLSWLGH